MNSKINGSNDIERFVEETQAMDEEQLIDVANEETTSSKLRVCVALARLQDLYGNTKEFKEKFLDGENCLVQDELDERGGSGCETEYRPRLVLAKATASEYATMGSIYLFYKEELSNAGFDSAFDMKKLLVVAALHKKADVRTKKAVGDIRTLSYREFKAKYSKPVADRGGVKYTSIFEGTVIRYKEYNVLTIDEGLYRKFSETLGTVCLQGFVNKLRRATDELLKGDAAGVVLEGVSEGNAIADASEAA
jgi:hypothetical protein